MEQQLSHVQVLGIDAGGTMTDTFFVRSDGRFVVGKAQSNPADESLAILESSRDALTQWARGGLLRVSYSPGQALMEADAMRGKDVFEKRCTGCHALDQDREGPRLRGVFGRTSGTVPNFDYSPALQKAHIVWNETTLDQWLTDTDALVPGNNMDFHVAKEQERRDLIRFLRESAAK